MCVHVTVRVAHTYNYADASTYVEYICADIIPQIHFGSTPMIRTHTHTLPEVRTKTPVGGRAPAKPQSNCAPDSAANSWPCHEKSKHELRRRREGEGEGEGEGGRGLRQGEGRQCRVGGDMCCYCHILIVPCCSCQMRQVPFVASTTWF